MGYAGQRRAGTPSGHSPLSLVGTSTDEHYLGGAVVVR